MSRISKLLSLALLLALAAFSASQAAAQAPRSGLAPVLPAQANGIAGQYIVVLKEGVDPRAAAAVAQVNPMFVYEAALNGFAAQLNAGQVTALQHNPNVAYIEQDQVVSVNDDGKTHQGNATWGIDRIDARSGTDGTYSYTNTGSGVKAYIIDTGIRITHQEFGNRAVHGYDAIDNDYDATDCNGHGTHVAGTVGGAEYGVAKGATLEAVRVLDCNGSGTWSGVIAGMDWVTADHNGPSDVGPDQPAVANMSLGGSANSSVDAAVDRMIDDGIAVAVAAGNGNIAGVAQDACRYSPARVPRAMTIGATKQDDAKTSWSNYGKCVDWFAPGANITSAWHIGDTAINTISGTSMATPHVAGVAALYLQSNPGATALQTRNALFDLTTKGIVKSSKTANNHLLFTNF